MTDHQIREIILARKKKEQRLSAITEIIASVGVVSLPFLYYFLIYSIM